MSGQPQVRITRERQGQTTHKSKVGWVTKNRGERLKSSGSLKGKGEEMRGEEKKGEERRREEKKGEERRKKKRRVWNIFERISGPGFVIFCRKVGAPTPQSTRWILVSVEGTCLCGAPTNKGSGFQKGQPVVSHLIVGHLRGKEKEKETEKKERKK